MHRSSRSLQSDRLRPSPGQIVSSPVFSRTLKSTLNRSFLGVKKCQDKFDHDKGQKSAISGRRLHWRVSIGFLAFSPVFMCNLVRRAPWNLEKVAKNPVEKSASNPVTSVAVMAFPALKRGDKGVGEEGRSGGQGLKGKEGGRMREKSWEERGPKHALEKLWFWHLLWFRNSLVAFQCICMRSDPYVKSIGILIQNRCISVLNLSQLGLIRLLHRLVILEHDSDCSEWVFTKIDFKVQCWTFWSRRIGSKRSGCWIYALTETMHFQCQKCKKWHSSPVLQSISNPGRPVSAQDCQSLLSKSNIRLWGVWFAN